VRAFHRRAIPFLFTLLALFAVLGTARAAETIDGNNPPTVRNNMHSCPTSAIVTGVNVGANQLLCLGNFVDIGGPLTTGERVDSGVQTTNQWPPDAVTRAAYAYTGPTMHWCGPDQYVTGVDVLNNRFNCARFPSATNINYTPRLGNVVLDPGTSPTVRGGMHACPRGTVLVGAHFGNNTFLCAELPFCLDTAQCPSSLDTCEVLSTGCATSDCIAPTTGVCRRQGTMSFREDNGCLQDFDGTLTDRSGNTVRFPDNDSFSNDEGRSLQLTNVHAGTVVRVYDDSSGWTGDDWTQIFVKATGSYCVGTFQSSSNSSGLTVEHHRVDNLDGKVSRVEVRSAILDFAGRCLDVNTNDNSAQIFGCHAGDNQSWINRVNGEIRGWNNLCLEASNTEIQAWPQLAAGQVRRAAVRTAACTGGSNQKWTVTEAGQIRMFGDMCLDIVGGTSQDHAALQIYPCHGGQNQRWVSSF
jgi:hypothetical protein